MVTLGHYEISIAALSGNSGSGANTSAGGSSGWGIAHLDYLTSYTGDVYPVISVSQDTSLGNTDYYLRFYVSSDGTSVNSESLQYKLTGFAVDVWEHLAVTWDASASEANFYWDGSLIGTATGAITSIYNSTALFGIGASFDAAGAAEDFYDGKADENRVWNDIRTASEISGNMLVEIGATAAGLAAAWQHDSSLLDETANNNDLTHVNTPTYDTTDVPFSAPTTRLDIDQQDTSTGNTTVILTTIDESDLAERQSFVPAKDPQKSIQVNISVIGTTADWTLVVHDPQNREIATITVTNAQLNTGLYEFTFATPWRPVIGATYHFHITVTNTTGAPATVSGSANDLETTLFNSYYQFLVTDGDYHPIEQVINKLGIGNGRYLASWDATTYDPHELTFPSSWRVRCLAPWREYLAIGCWRGVDGDDIEDYDQGIIFFWDGISDTYNFYINVPEGGVNAIFGSQGTLYIVAGYEGSLLEYTGGDKAVKVKTLPKLGVGEQIEVHPQALTMWKTLLRIGAGVTDSSAFEQGIYTWGSLNRNYTDSLSFDYAISTQNTQSISVQVGMLLPVAEKLLVGWKDNVSYGLDNIDLTYTTYANGSIEFLIRDEGGVWKEKLVALIRADFEPLATDEQIGLQYKLDRADNWTSEETETTADKDKLRVQVKGGRHKEYQIRLNMQSTTTTSPAVIGVTVDEDLLEGDKII